jgi:hypothetical protein
VTAACSALKPGKQHIMRLCGTAAAVQRCNHCWASRLCPIHSVLKTPASIHSTDWSPSWHARLRRHSKAGTV